MSRRPRILVAALLLAAAGAAPAFGETAFDPAPYLGTRWYGVYLFGEKVGYGSFRLEEFDDRGDRAFRSVFRVDYRISVGGDRQEMAIREEKIYQPDGELAAFTSVQESPLGRVSFSGRREGDVFRVDTASGERTAPAAGEKLADSLAHLELVRANSRPGDSVTVRLFETTLLMPVTVTHTVKEVEERYPGGVRAKIYRIRTEFPELGLTTSSLIDGELRTIEGKVGMVTIREEEEESAPGTGSGFDLFLAAAVRPDRRIPRPREIRTLRLKLSGPVEPDPALNSLRQEFEKIAEDSYYVRISSPPARTDQPPDLPLAGENFPAELEATAYIQADHSRIREKAREIIGEEKNPRRAAELLTGWVFRNLDKSFLAAIPNAVDVLNKKSGDCKAHSVLLVALARSLGLPARTVSGLVAMEDGLFYYHQWAELYTGEWTPADPVFGQIPVDAGHVELSRSGPAQQLKLLNLIGQLRIEVLEWE